MWVRSQWASDVLRKRTVDPLDQPAISAAEAVPRSTVMGWRRARGNRIGNKPETPIGLQPDVAPRKTSAGPVGPHSSRRYDRAHRARSCIAAPASSADAWCTWWHGAATRSWKASCRAVCISAVSTSAARMRGSCRAFGSARDRRPTSCSLKSLITSELTTVLARVRAHSSSLSVYCRAITTCPNDWTNWMFFRTGQTKIELF